MPIAVRTRDIVTELIRTAVTRRSVREVAAFATLTLACIALSVGLDFVLKSFGVPAEAFRENGPVETLQAILVGAAGLVFYIAAIRFDYELFYASVILAPVCGLAVIREIPNCGSRFYDGGVCLGDGGKDTVTIVVLLASVVLLAIKREPMARRIADLNFFWIVPSTMAGLCLVVAEIMEKQILMGPEETLETSAYFILFAFAVAINLRPRWFDARCQDLRRSQAHHGAP